MSTFDRLTSFILYIPSMGNNKMVREHYVLGGRKGGRREKLQLSETKVKL